MIIQKLMIFVGSPGTGKNSSGIYSQEKELNYHLKVKTIRTGRMLK